MIKVEITKKDGIIEKIIVKGHANYSEYGKDIVCAAVSSLVLCTINGILSLEGNTITTNYYKDTLTISIDKYTFINEKLIKNMINSLNQIEKDYSKNIKITYIGG